MTIPARLFKYQPFSDQSVSNLRRRQLFFPSPRQFNDPFDCRYQAHQQLPTPSELDRLISLYESRVGRAVPELREWVAGDPEGSAKALTTTHPQILDRLFAGRGVTCLSARKDNLLMWGHYADGHRGFCLEFDTAVLPASKALPVVYQSTYPRFSAAEVALTLDANRLFEVAVLSKSVDWAYEEEWRILKDEAGSTFGYDHSALTSIYLGARMPEKHRQQLLADLRGTATRFYEMLPDSSEYALQALVWPRA